MGRPQRVFIIKGNKRRLSRDYLAYLSSEIGMKSCERKEWGNLGVNLTRQKENKIVDFFGAVDFIERPCGGSE